MKKEKTEAAPKAVDQELVKEKELAYDALNLVAQNKKYQVVLDTEAVSGLLEFFDYVEWKGAECYVIDKMYDVLIPALETVSEEDDTFSLDTAVEGDVIEGMFYFIKNYTGNGIESAQMFKKLADGFAKPMQELSMDRAALRDASLELVAAESGMTAEEMISSQKQA